MALVRALGGGFDGYCADAFVGLQCACYLCDVIPVAAAAQSGDEVAVAGDDGHEVESVLAGVEDDPDAVVASQPAANYEFVECGEVVEA